MVNPTYYSWAFQDCPQTPSLMVLMNLLICTMFSLEPQSFSADMAPWGQCCVHASLYRGQDCTTCSGVVSLFHCMGSWLCVNPTTMTAGDVPQNLSQRVFSSFFSKLANIVFHWWCDYSKLANIVFHWWCDYSKLANVVFRWWCDYSKLAKSFTDDVTTAS